MSVRLTLTTAGVNRLQARMTNRANFLGGARVRGVLQEAGRDAVATAIQTASAFVPGRVRDLSPGYRVDKAKRYGHTYPILTGTGAMLASMYSRVFQTQGAGWVIRIGFAGRHPSGISNQQLAATHLYGGGSVPARDFLSLPARWGAQWINRIRTELKSTR